LTVCVNGIEQSPFDFRPNGASLVERDQRKYMEEEGGEVYTVRPWYPGLPEGDHEIHLPSIVIPGTDGFRIAYPIDPLTQWMLDGLIGQIKPEMIYLHGPYQVADRLTRIAKKYKIPYALHMHTHLTGYVEARTPEFLWPVAKRFSLKRAIRIANGAAVTIFPSETYRKVFVSETGFSHPSIVFPSFIEPFPMLDAKELEKANYQLRARHININNEMCPGIMVLSRLEREKNPQLAMHSFARLLRLIKQDPIEGIKWPVLIYVGGGTDKCKQELVSLAKDYGIEKKVLFAGPRSGEESREFLQTASQCWFLSKMDTQGFVPLEAGYAGIPVFGLHGQPFQEFFGQEAYLTVSPDCPDILAARSYLLLKDREKHLEKAAFCKKVATRYSDTKKYKEDFLDICKHVVVPGAD